MILKNKPIYIILIFSTLLMLLIFIRFYPLIKYSPMANTFESGGAYAIYYMQTTGHLFSQNEVYSDKYSAFGAGLGEVFSYPLLYIHSLLLVLFCGFNAWSWEYRIFNYLIYSTLFLLSCMLFYFKYKHNNFSNFSLLIVGLYILFSTPKIITMRGASGWILITINIYLLFLFNLNTKKSLFLSTFFLVILPAVYFTSALFFWALFFIYYLYRIYFLKINDDMLKNRLFIYSLFLIVHALYMSTSRFVSLIAVYSNFIIILHSIFNPIQKIGFPIEYLVETSFLNKIKIACNAFFVVLTPLLFIYWYPEIREKIQKLSQILLVYLIFCLPLLGIFSWVWLGSLGVPRLGEYGGLLSVIVFCILYKIMSKKKRYVLLIISVLVVSTSIFTSVTDENEGFSWITVNEDVSIIYLKNYLNTDDGIFTDHRLGGSLIGIGHLKTTGVAIQHNDLQNTIYDIQAIYYGNDPVSAKIRMKNIKLYNGQDIEYSFFSFELSKTIPGINLYETPVKAAPTDYLNKYLNSPIFNKIFSSFDCNLFGIY